LTPQQQGKRVQRAIRHIPTEQIAAVVRAMVRDGLWCLVDGELVFVPADGSTYVTNWDDPVEYAQFVRYVLAYPDRVHVNHEEALKFVRSRLGVAD
jgi:hypothetical protein